MCRRGSPDRSSSSLRRGGGPGKIIEDVALGWTALVLLGLLIGSPAPAAAAEDAVDGGVDASGVTITIVRWQGTRPGPRHRERWR